jgi:hypothetical protein
VSSERWMTFVRNHAQAVVACDFRVVVTATFGLLYVNEQLEMFSSARYKCATETAVTILVAPRGSSCSPLPTASSGRSRCAALQCSRVP